MGVFSAYYNKFFVAFLVASIPIAMAVANPFITVGLRASEIMGSKNPFHVYIVGFEKLPADLQMAILLFPFFMLSARVLVYLGAYFFPKDIIPETEGEKRVRILTEHEKKLKAHAEKPMQFK